MHPANVGDPDFAMPAISRRHLGLGIAIGLTPLLITDAAGANDFITTPSGLKVLDIRSGTTAPLPSHSWEVESAMPYQGVLLIQHGDM